MVKYLFHRQLFIYLLFVSLHDDTCFGQFRSNQWVIGDSILITFNGSATPVVGAMPADAFEANATISDSVGNLIFYAHSRRGFQCFQTYLYNKLGNYMYNSSGIYGNCSATNGVLIIPVPEDNNLFYVFYIGIVDVSNGSKIYYNIVDMTLDGGNGGVIQSNVLLFDTSSCEQLAAVRHANGRDWWVIFHSWASTNYIKHMITPNGILGPFIQSIGDSVGPTFSIIGEMVISQQGDKLCHIFGNGKIQLFDFDRCSGILSDLVQLGTNDSIQGYYGASFSETGNRLYVSTRDDSLFQFDLTSANIYASRQLIYLSNYPGFHLGQHQLAENGKIYISGEVYSGGSDTLLNYLSVINAPDSLGTDCNFSPFSFSLNSSATYAGLPNVPNNNLGPVSGSPCDSLTNTIHESTITNMQLYPNPANDKLTLLLNEKRLFIPAKLTPRTGMLTPPGELSIRGYIPAC